MASFDLVNYSLRPSKAIQRALVFEDIRRLMLLLGLKDLVYVGFGSVWFVDFQIAHRLLKASDLVSIELDDVGFVRAQFNAPFSSVVVKHGHSNVVLPPLYLDDQYKNRPWVMWLDYDFEWDESVCEDVRLAIERLPQNSMLITTFNAMGNKYGQPKNRGQRLAALLGGLVNPNRDKAEYDGDSLSPILRKGVLDYMGSIAGECSRPGGFVPGFSLGYRDQASMATVGGILPAPESRSSVQELVSSNDWRSLQEEILVAPHLTAKEATLLQNELPKRHIDRQVVQRLGFDLLDHQIAAFQKYYLYYPSFAQIVT